MKQLYAFFYLIYLELKRTAFGIKYFAEADVTDNCNLRCKGCYHFSGKDELERKELPINIWEERFKGLYARGIRFILLVGGEPALRKDVLMLADKIFPFIHIITNGTIKISEKFNHLLFVSLDGRQETNDSIRGKGVFSKVLSNYSHDSRAVFNMTISKENYKELKHVVKIAKENGFRGVVCNIHTPTRGKDSPLRLTEEERKLIIKELRQVKSEYPDHFLLTESMIKWYEFPNHTGFCHWGDEALHFDVSWKTRRCFTGLDCSDCGCFAGSVQNPLKLIKYPKEMMKLI